MQGTLRITFSLDIGSTGKTRSIVHNVDRALAKKKVLMLGSNGITMIGKKIFYDSYEDLYLSEKEKEEKLLRVVQ